MSGLCRKKNRKIYHEKINQNNDEMQRHVPAMKIAAKIKTRPRLLNIVVKSKTKYFRENIGKMEIATRLLLEKPKVELTLQHGKDQNTKNW